MAGGEGRDADADAVEVVGEERREAALRLCLIGQPVSRDRDQFTDLVSIWQLTVGDVLVWPREKLRP